jgi:hypothetical protein
VPTLLVGRAGGKRNPGRYITHPDGTPLTNLHLTLLDAIGVHQDRVGDSTGRLTDI